ncbi:hypothetical protein BH23ACT10_BH23ACT10_06850 [soil metagenome]
MVGLETRTRQSPSRGLSYHRRVDAHAFPVTGRQAELRPLFLLSMPRAGSTLLQRLLSSHSAVSTTAEPWVLLPPLWSLRRDGAFSTYSHREVFRGIDDLIPHLRGGRQAYLDAVAAFGMHLYRAASGAGVRYFLDKTPRYALVASDLFDAFPDARFVFLWRNPLAVAASIVDTWMAGRWQLHHHKVDLYAGLDALISAAGAHPQAYGLRYEDLVSDPRTQLRCLVDFLDIPWEDGLVDAHGSVTLPGRLGDPTRRERRIVDTRSINRWPKTLASPLRRRWAHGYLDWLGPDRLATMGYALSDLRAQLDHPPLRHDLVMTDAYDAAKSAMWSVVEPQSVRSKVAAVRAGRRIYGHT